MRQETLADKERQKGNDMLVKLCERLIAHEWEHTPFMNRWVELLNEHRTMIYPVKPQEAAKGRRLRYGKPARIIELIESAAPVGRLGIWFARVVA